MAMKNTRGHDETTIQGLRENNNKLVHLTSWRHIDSSKTNIYSKLHCMKINRIVVDNKCIKSLALSYT